MRRTNTLNLILQLTITEFKLKYAGSVLGYLWSLVKPILLFAVLYFVFTLVFKLGRNIPNYPVYLLIGVVTWTFFIEATISGMSSILARGDLIRKVNFPKYTIVLSAVLTSLLTFLLDFIIVFIFLIVSGIGFSFSIFLVPFLILELFLLILGISFILSSLYTKFRDFIHIWELTAQVMFYATPILYPISLVPERFKQIVMLNPMAQIIQDLRWALMSNEVVTSWNVLGTKIGILPIVLVLTILLCGMFIFSKVEKNFAEEV